MAVKFGLFAPQGWRQDLAEIADPIAQYEAMTRVARAADAEAYDSVWVFDHFHPAPPREPAPTFECWTIMATLARDTERIRLGQLVTCAGFRSPALLAKIASTVDVASHGRLNVGIGAGWYEDEWRAYGYGFPDALERLQMLRETVEVLQRMWTEEAPVFAGTHHRIDQPINEPKGVQRPHPPLWIGGGGERVTLKLVAQWADACNINGDPATIRHKLAVLRQHCAAVGRDDSEIVKSTCVLIQFVERAEDVDRVTVAPVRMESVIIGTPTMVREQLQTFVDAGVDYFIVTLPRVAYDQEPLRRFARDVVSLF